MYYMYILYSDSLSEYYVGSTSDLKRRFSTHNSGQSTATKRGMPWRLVYYEAYLTKADARKRELKLKHHGKGLAELKKRISLV